MATITHFRDDVEDYDEIHIIEETPNGKVDVSFIIDDGVIYITNSPEDVDSDPVSLIQIPLTSFDDVSELFGV